MRVVTRLLLAAALVAVSAAFAGGGTASAACEPFCLGTVAGDLARILDEHGGQPCRPNC